MSERDEILAWNPATAQLIGRVEAADEGTVVDAVARARGAQTAWAALPFRDRRAAIERWRRGIASRADAWSGAITAEIGKPRVEAMGEVSATLDQFRWMVRNGRRWLRDRRRWPHWQRWMMLGPGRVRRMPYGVIGIFGTWNYPLFLNAPAIAGALLSGNAVVWKPSELAPLVCQRVADSISEAGIHPGVFQIVHGSAEIGRALARADIDKIQYTGGLEGGRAVQIEAARRGIAATMELSGYDAGIVLADVSARGVAEAIAWTGYVNCGQACVATKRLYVVGQDPEPWVAALAAAARRLRIGDPDRDEIDLGPMIRESARARFLSQIQGACGAGAVCVAGGVAADGAGWFVEPTVLHARSAEAERALEGVFGPVILVRGVATLDEAIGAANASSFGLAGSIWTRDKRKAMAVASRLQVGMVTINDGVLPSAHARSPFGGMKASGFGRVHGPEGLHEVTQPQVVFKRGLGGLRPQVYPYTGMSRSLVEIYLRLFHGVVGSRKR